METVQVDLSDPLRTEDGVTGTDSVCTDPSPTLTDGEVEKPQLGSEAHYPEGAAAAHP